MASLCKQVRDGNVTRLIQFGKPRKTLHLGDVSLKQGRIICGHVDELITAHQTKTTPPPLTAGWLGEISDDLHKKLVKHKLAKPRIGANAVLLGAFIDAYIAKRTDLKADSITNLKQAKKKMVGFFGAMRDITTITRGDMQDYQRHLTLMLSEASASRLFKRARQFLEDADSFNLIDGNPAKGIKAGSQENTERLYHVPEDAVMAMMDIAPDADWQLLLALARFGGLRIPSETNALKWSDINFKGGKFTVRSTKTARYKLKGVRDVPIFPELLPHLLAARQRRDTGETRAMPRLRHRNLRKRVNDLRKLAGLEAWPRLFQNMRASRQTDLVNQGWSEHTVCYWLGNSEKIARKHYLMVTDNDYQKARGVAHGTMAATEAGNQGQGHQRNGALREHPLGHARGQKEVSAVRAGGGLGHLRPVQDIAVRPSLPIGTGAMGGASVETKSDLNAAQSAAHVDEMIRFPWDCELVRNPVGVTRQHSNPIKSGVSASRHRLISSKHALSAQRGTQRKAKSMRSAATLRRLLQPLALVPDGRGTL